ncbi:cytochrome c oxidase subunit II [Pseudomonas sp. 10B1]|uniref:cytochrome c oxidase subunit II n=1 Tax=unclassified Pseudomonas TaxID=196821 RepID=UPI002AB37F33|nr:MULTISPECIES: cytochrome c oxidase subunit II [unclassified Pseudomonas]MDY7562502.1 cytochrome c oxidase subunit II [Pseudomonas sp. AB6]MEA9979094.1 cytochrome c oxidase subunit II [Pseudomonas sp. RTS4]MEA9995552.1 cytochrome c oxidase subunit II [Pseudomonas sp. AA4]MEB0086587.1 cytochrome c oxidase subunit II [Pseudomonas sp. RTI1]MEB0127543.1 cytochrome c oxidase subunit II [Pseudomonas sp. CCC1.2]
MMRHPYVWMGLLLSSIFNQAQAAWTTNMAPGATEVSHEIFDLHMTIFWICVVIGIVVFGAMFWSMILHRRSTGQVAAKFHESTRVEIAWTIVPLVILIVMVIPATRTMIKMYDTGASDIDIQITGYQWKWHYKYLGQDVEFFSNLATPAAQIHNKEAKGENYLLEVDEPLVIPVGKKIRFLVTAADVIHSWWVPAFAVKRDAIPGFINEAWTRVDKPGIYRGQCSELCGKDHGFMPIVVEAKTQADYDTWLAGRKLESAKLKELTSKDWTMDELVARGDKVYHTTCVACHQAEGQGLPPMFPALKGSKTVTGPKEGHLNTVFHGRPGTAMAAFGKQLSEVDIAAVVTYERNAWGNNKGDMVTPKDVLALKQADAK